MIRRISFLICLVATPAIAQDAEDWPPPPGPICGEIESGVEADFRFHETQLTAENYRDTASAMFERIPDWLTGGGNERRQVFFYGDVSMAYFNNLNFMDLYVMKLEVLSATDAERAEAVTRFCNALAHRVIMD